MRLVNENLIKKWEGLRLEAYKPTPNDVWTIGWGHTKGVFPGMKINRDTAQKYFEEDVKWAVDAVNRLVKVGLTQNQFDALVSLTFNIGETAFGRSTLLKKLNAGDYDGAADEFPKWKYQSGKVLKGLVRRRSEEMEYFLTPSVNEPSPNFLAENGANGTLKSLSKSKEIIAGVGAAVTGVFGGLATLTPEVQDKLSTALIVALVGFGLYVVYNRISARSRGER